MIKKILIGTFMFLCLFNFSKFYAFSCNTNSIGDNFKLTLLSGGCDEARQFSFKSAYGVYHNLKLFKDIEIQILYVDDKMNAYIINETYLHLNTHDFNLKICNNKKLDNEEFIKVLRQTDIVMPIVFGDFGEGGELQRFLEKNNIAFMGSGSKGCNKMFNKAHSEIEIIQKYNFKTIPKLILNKNSNISEEIVNFFDKYQLKDAIIKPAKGGSSIGVEYAKDVKSAIKIAMKEINERGEILVEKVCKGKEFTILILENDKNKPIAFLPIEINYNKTNTINIFTTDQKYFSGSMDQHTSARFNYETIQTIREQAEKLFKFAEANDYLRIDGWVLDDGEIYFSDFNNVPGMGSDSSFFFQSAKDLGINCQSILGYILENSARRQNIKSIENFNFYKKYNKDQKKELISNIKKDLDVY